MKKVRGFVYLEGKTLNEIISYCSNFRKDNLNIYTFNSLVRNQTNIQIPGVFIEGYTNYAASSEIVNFLRKQAGLEEKTINCDVSIETEDIIKSIKEGETRGNYIGIRFRPPYTFEKIENVAGELESILEPSNILLRTVETEEEDDYPMTCLDLITNKNPMNHKQKIEEAANKYNIKVEKYTLINNIS